MQVNHNRARSRIHVTSDGEGIVFHARALLLARLADRIGLTADLSRAMASTRRRRSAHDPGKVLVDLAVALPTAPTAWPTSPCCGPTPTCSAPSPRTPRRGGSSPRSGRWSSTPSTPHGPGPGPAPGRPGCGGAGSCSTSTRPSSPRIPRSRMPHPPTSPASGFHPVMCYLDGTGEALAGMLRAGNAGSNTAADHLGVVDQALAQLPVATRPTTRTPASGCSCAPTPPRRPTRSSTGCGSGASSSRSASRSPRTCGRPCSPSPSGRGRAA